MTTHSRLGAAALLAIALAASTSSAGEVRFRSFSASAAIGPPAEAFANKLRMVTQVALGISGELRFIKLTGIPAIPPQFASDIVSAVAAGEMGGGFDAAYISGSDLNKTWGFLFNSGVPFGPTFDEYIGFLYGSGGMALAQELVSKRGVVAIPIVGSPEQLSGYFAEPMDSVRGHRGIGLAGLCQQAWVLRYLPPGENVLNLACDDLVARKDIKRKAITFIAAVPGGGSLVDAVMAGTLHGFEFATPIDDVSQLFSTGDNPGTVGLRYVHTPGWQQQFLITWMIVNRPVWNTLTAAQQVIFQTVARDHVLSTYADNLRLQGPALEFILDVNKQDGNPDNDMVMTRWPLADQMRLRAATIKFLNARAIDPALPAADRTDYARVLDALRAYVRANDRYWDVRQVNTSLRFDDWTSAAGECWSGPCAR